MSSLTKVLLITVFIFIYLPNLTLAQNPGDLDTTFGVGGKVITDISSGGAWSIAIQPDGKIILAGYSHPIPMSYREITLIRYLFNGDIDNNFGTNGVVIFDVSNMDADVFSVDLQTDSKIVAAGYSTSSNNADFTVVRFDSTGNPDSTFGGDGKVITDIRNDGDCGESLAIQPDGKIIVAGWTSGVTNSDIAVIRLNSNGSLDNSFDGDGIVITDINSMNDVCKGVAIQTDGKIVVAGYSTDGSQFVITVVRYDSTGNLDGTFGTGGIVTTEIGGADVFGQAVTIQQDGKIIVAGKRFSSGNEHFILVRYNTHGNLDNSFGNNGITITTIGVNSEASSVVIDSNGYIIAGGRAQTSNNNFALARYNESGSLDATFGNSGIVITNMIGSSQDYGRSLELQSDGKILLAGEVYDTDFNFGVARYIGRLSEITVLSPNGGEVWLLGSQQDITWESENVTHVSIELSIDSGATCTVIVDSLVNTGTYTWTVSAPNLSENCLIRINDIDDVNIFDMSDSVFTIDQVTSLNNNNLPETYALYLNYPNPFNPTTNIKYEIPELNFVTLKIYDVLGSEITILINEEKPTGSYVVEFDATGLPSGIYFYRLQAGDFVEAKKMVLLR